MHSYFVSYEGDAAGLAAFRDYYRREHAAILLRLPGLRSLVLHEAAHVTDPFPTQLTRVVWMAQMIFDNADALSSALASSERELARIDFGRFPPFAAVVSHGSFNSELISE